MPTIHPTAIIDPLCTLEEGVIIGPHTVIEGKVHISEGTEVLGSAWIKGPMTIGRHNRIYPYATLGLEPQDRKITPDHEGPGTKIGDNNIFRESCSIHRGGKQRATCIGDDNYFMANSHVAHDCLVGSRCMFANAAMIGGHCEVQDNVIIGGGGAAQQFTRIGRFAFLGGNEGMTRDLPPFCMVHHTRLVSSLNVIGLRRNGYQELIDGLRTAFDILYRQGLPNPSAVTRIREQLPDNALAVELADFVADSKGITPYGPASMFKARGQQQALTGLNGNGSGE